MKERPILFSGPMVRALLEGRKTQTRRVVRSVRGYEHNNVCRPDLAADPWAVWWHGEFERVGCLQECPYGQPGDRLWVRETWQCFVTGENDLLAPQPRPAICSIGYAATEASRVGTAPNFQRFHGPWRPSIFMPRWVSRITLELMEVRVQRLQAISEDDARAEGVEPFFQRFPNIGREQRLTSGELAADAEHRASYAVLWDEINGDRALWSSNPWVWALTFSVLPKGAS